MDQKNKKNKKIKSIPLMTLEERLTWVDEIKSKLDGLGCTCQWGAINELHQIMDEWVETGVTQSGKIDFWEAPMGGRDIVYLLNSRKDRDNVVNMLMKDRDKVKN